MSLRPSPSPAGTVIRGAATVLIVIHIMMSAWLVVQFDGRYTEGRPSPTNIKALVAVDDERTLIDVKMENSTSFVLYMLTRDYEEPPSNETPTDQPDSSSSTDSGESEERLSQARLFTKACLVVMILTELAMLLGLRFRGTLRGVSWTAVLLCFLVVLPGAYLSDLTGGDGSEDSNERKNTSNNDLANETFVAQTEEGSMVHGTSDIKLSLAPLGVHIDMMFNGYDLGLVEKANQSAVRAEAPEPDSKDASSWVQFESRLTAKAGKNIQSLFILPVLWLVFPAMSLKKEASSAEVEGDEEA
ncbi:MAG: hypothetical protein L7S56_04855 [Candidatus Poseidonia sp.]|nr:hypothetical protein [Poseidonia sp.]